jgi:ABC-2 type transport system permease protein
MSAAAFAATLSARDFLAVYPPRVYLLTTLPRAVLQVAFVAFVGYYAAGADGREFAFIGACAHIIVLATVVRAPDVLIDERIMGTLHRVRLGVLPLPAVVIARWWVFVAAGMADALVAAVVAAPLVGELDLVLEVLGAAPLFLLVALTTSGVGLVVGALSLTQRIDVLLTNLAAYVMLVFCGVVAPVSVFGDVGEPLVRLLPLTNGLLAIRQFVAGENWLSNAGLELAVGAAWLCVAVLLMKLQEHRARRLGTDELL